MELSQIKNYLPQEVLTAEVPKTTKSYSPVAHDNIINDVAEELDKRNLGLQSVSFNSGRKGQQLIGKFTLEGDHKDDDSLNQQISFRNSYDKSMSLAFVSGDRTWICKNGMISGDMKFVRKHTGTIASEISQRITETVDSIEQTHKFNNMVKGDLKSIKVNKSIMSELAGRMFIEQDIIKSTQLSIIKREILDPSFEVFKEENMWSFYNHCTYSLKENHPLDHINAHQKVHEFITA